ESLGIRRRVRAPLIQRTLFADNTAVAHMRDVINPEIQPPPADDLRAVLEAGKMPLDAHVEHGVPVAFARTHLKPAPVEPESRVGQAIEATRVTATLELVETLHTVDGRAVQHSTEVFRPGSIDLHVMRSLKASSDGQAATR